MEIRQYSKADEVLFFNMLIDEGDDWSEHHVPVGRSKYIKTLEQALLIICTLGA